MEKTPHRSVLRFRKRATLRFHKGATGLPRAEHVRVVAVVGLALASLALTAGCDNPLARQRIEQRQSSLNWTANALAWRECEAPERLQRDFEFIKQNEQAHAEMFARDLRYIQDWFEYDVRRWRERQDDYWAKIAEILRGKPEKLEDTAIILFY
ncbi:MAG: hypothetical protein KBH81_06980 [Phycisphaerae bacterium]|jgi:hypothetical protein|nr:hypothetical protein [Phycisphaerae bacterium]